MTDAELTREERRLMENNNAKLREALDDIGNACAWIADNCNDGQIAKYMWDIVEKVKAALAAPPRNCDVYPSVAEARNAFICEPCEHPCGDCTVCDDDYALCRPCGIKWLFEPAKKGGAE